MGLLGVDIATSYASSCQGSEVTEAVLLYKREGSWAIKPVSEKLSDEHVVACNNVVLAFFREFIFSHGQDAEEGFR